jgi:chromosome segregation ATPase
MKTIKLLTLSLRNFKGIELMELSFSGSDKDIFGANESGKSTIVTAFNWLLTGKDEFDRKDFKIKNTVKKELNSQPHIVEGIFNVNGSELKLKRVYSEIWTKKKGQPLKEFTGNTTDFYFNDVPCKEAEYNSKVNDIIPLDLIRLLTNSTHFTSLPWQNQRQELLRIAGAITNQQVLDAIATPANDYGTLIMILNSGKTLDDYKKELAAKKLLLKKAATEFAPRIDEAKLNMPKPADWEQLQAELDNQNLQVANIDEMLESAGRAAAVLNKAINEKQQFLYKREALLQEIKNRIRVEVQEKQQTQNNNLLQLQHSIKTASIELSQVKQQSEAQQKAVENYKTYINGLNSRIEGFRAEWKKVNAEKFVFDPVKCQCPTCGQQLQADVIEQKQDQLQNNFLTDQTSRKNDLVAKSNQVKAEIQQYQMMIDKTNEVNYQQQILDNNNKLEALHHQLKELQAAAGTLPIVNIDSAVEALVNVNEDALYLVDEIKALQDEIAADQLRIPGNENEGLKADKKAILLQMDPIKQQLAQRTTIELTQKRILQLLSDEQKNGQALADLENLEFDIETFTRAKMDILESRVNGMFKYVSFRLFEKQVNGGIAETCTCEYKGVEFATLNTAAKILAGVDIISTLSRFYNITAPIFIDNRESVTFIPDHNNQLISLYMNAEFKSLEMKDPKTNGKNIRISFRKDQYLEQQADIKGFDPETQTPGPDTYHK